MLESVERYKAMQEAIGNTVRDSVYNNPFVDRAVFGIDEATEWVRSKLASFGMTAAVEDCVGKHKLGRYAAWVAAETLSAANPVFPEFAITAILTGDAEVDYWRAATIAAKLKDS